MQCQWCGRRTGLGVSDDLDDALCVHCAHMARKMNEVIQESDHRNPDECNGVAWVINRLKEKLRRSKVA